MKIEGRYCQESKNGVRITRDIVTAQVQGDMIRGCVMGGGAEVESTTIVMFSSMVRAKTDNA